MRYKSRSRALAASALAATVGLAGLGLVAPAAGAAPAETDRIAGVNRYETAADIAQLALPNADTVVLTTGEKLPDALSANPIAGAEDAPILLTLTASIPTFTQQALDAIDPTNVIIVGGTSAVSTAVENELEADGFTVTREAGVDRFETAAEVALEVGVAPDIDADGTGGEPALATVAIANGLTGLPDAVAASPMLHQMDIPLLLTGPDTLNEDAAAAIEDLGAEQALLLGGTAAISNAIEQGLEADGINAERLAGTDRWGTAAAIADFEIDRLGFDAATTYIASGFSLADALAGGPLASVTNSPIVLVAETSVPAPTARWIEDNAADIDEIIALGGTAVINDTVLAEAAELADEGDAGQVALTSSSVQQGGTVTGTITGDNIQSVTVSGCGLTNQVIGGDTDPNTVGRQFNLTVPQNQATGNCTLTFTVTTTDGATATETETLTVAGPNAGSQGTATTRPELVSASVVQTNAQGTTVRYLFDEALTGDFLPAFARFHVYRFGYTGADPDGAGVLVAGPNDVDTANADDNNGDAAQIETGNTRAVLVTFIGITTAQGAGQLSLATVDFDAVRGLQTQNNTNNDANIIGDAPLNQGTTAQLAAGITAAPDLVSVSNFRANPGDNTQTLVDFTFDQAAFNEAGQLNNNVAGYHLIGIDGETDNVGTIVAGSGTTVHTVAFENDAGAGFGTSTVTVTAASIARGTVDTNTVDSATGAAGVGNPQQAADVSNGGNTETPDLVSAEIRRDVLLANGTTRDQILYTFDEPILATGFSLPNEFRAYLANGNEFQSSAAAGDPAPTRSTTSDTSVLVTFAQDSLDFAVGASAIDNTVAEGSGGQQRGNQQDEVGISNVGTGPTTVSGLTAAPDLTAASVERVTDLFGTTTGARVRYTFDEDVFAPVAGRLFIVLSDGTRYVCNQTLPTAPAPGGTEETDNQVTCTSFVNVDDATSVATTSQILSAVVATVDDGAVNNQAANTGPGTNPAVPAASGGETNPEGAALVTGTTGTAQQ